MKPTVRRTLLAGLALLGLTGLGYAANNLVFGGRGQRPPGTPHVFRVQLGVGDAQVRLVAEGVRPAERAFSDLLGTAVPQPVTVRLARRGPCIPFSRGSETAVAAADELCIDTDGPGWRLVPSREPATALSIAAHELFHSLQGQLGCLLGPNDHRYARWVEGSAAHLGWRAVEHAGRVTETNVTAKMRAWGGWRPGLGRLKDHERGIPGDPEYALAQRAVAGGAPLEFRCGREELLPGAWARPRGVLSGWGAPCGKRPRGRAATSRGCPRAQVGGPLEGKP